MRVGKQYWLVKTEPGEYGWDDLEKEGEVVWSGVKSHQASNNLKKMLVGDDVLFYHSGKSPAIVGVASVVKTAYPDPSDIKWHAVDLKPLRKLNFVVSLKSIKGDTAFVEMPLVKQPRLSVMPIKKHEFKKIETLSLKGD